MIAAVAFTSLALLVPGSSSGFRPLANFGTPGKAAYCTVDASSHVDYRPKLFCWTPNDGYGVSLRYRGGRPAAAYYTRDVDYLDGYDSLVGWAPRTYTLRFGQRWVLRCPKPSNVDRCRSSGVGVTAFTCTSRSSGLTCTNPLRHGFWLGRYRGVRRF